MRRLLTLLACLYSILLFVAIFDGPIMWILYSEPVERVMGRLW